MSDDHPERAEWVGLAEIPAYRYWDFLYRQRVLHNRAWDRALLLGEDDA